MEKVLTIVVTFNGMKWLESCLGSLRDSCPRPDVLVVDNGSADGTREWVRENFPEVEMVFRDDNPGFGAANNIGLRLALERGYDYVYLLNQDAWVEKDTIRLLIEAARPGYGILSPVQNDASGRMDRQFERKCGKYLLDGQSVAEVPFVMAAHWLIPVYVIRKVGGFSPAFKQYGEDDNYIDRLHYSGLRCAVVTAAKATHDRSARQTPKDKRMRLKCIAVVVRLSSPLRPFALRAALAPFELAGMAVKNLSLVPLRFIPSLFGRMGKIRKIRSVSKELGAFLNEAE